MMSSDLTSAAAAWQSPSDPDLADAAHEWKSAYVHIPFCRRRCPYCDFAIVDESLTGGSDHDAYIQALLAEIAMDDGIGPLDAVNFGGGTPSAVDPLLLGRIVDALSRRFGIVDGAEVSLEVNPEDWTDDLGEALVGVGFNRVSIGGQSMDDAILGVLGRSHTTNQVSVAVDGARAAGFRSVGVDVMIGHPSESAASWDATVDAVLSLGIDHLSTYTLTVEPGTQLSRDVSAGALAPDEDIQADRYELLAAAAARLGFERYEVSNMATTGHACRYNLSTWAHGEYLGFGLGAHDHRWGVRSRNHRRLDRYEEAVASGDRPRVGTEHLTPREQDRDRLMLGLRLACGTPVSGVATSFLATDAARRFIDAGILVVDGSRLVVTDPLLADAVAREALSVSGSDC